MAATRAAVRPAANGGAFNFGDLSAYSTGGGLPEGDYIWKDCTIKMHEYTKADGTPASKGGAKLGVMITVVPMNDLGAQFEQFYGLGSKAHESWQPNPETGKGIVPIPGGPGIAPNNMTKWAMLYKSLIDSGLPNGILQDDFSVLEGMHCHMANIPEPKEWAGYQSKTGEAAEERKSGTIAVVTEIKDDGKPWEGTGGMPEAAPAKPAPAAKTVKLAAKPIQAKPAPAPAPAPAGDDALQQVAENGISTVLLEKNPHGCKKVALRTGTFKAVSTAPGGDATLANKVLSAYFGSDEALNSILNPLGYEVDGLDVRASA
jgi:hypothetical protein